MRAKSSNLGLACAVAPEMSAKSSTMRAWVRMSHSAKNVTASVHRMCRRLWYERDVAVIIDSTFSEELRLE